MALRTEKDIIKAVKDRENDQNVRDLRDRFESDFGMWMLEAYQLGKKGEYDNYTTNEPKNLGNKLINILGAAPLKIEIPIDKDDEEARRRKSDAERFIYGALNLNDSRLQVFPQPNTQGQMAFHSNIRGWWATRVYIHKGEDGVVIPDIKIWDFLNTTWGLEGNGVCFKRTISPAQAKDEYKVDINKSTQLYDFWDDEVNAIIINETFVKRPEKHGLKHCPVKITMVGATPFIQSEKYQSTLKYSGESCYDGNRGTYEPKSKLITYLMTIVGLASHNPLAIYSSGGKKTFQKSPYYKGAVIQLDVDKKESVENLVKPEMPRDFLALLQVLNREQATGGVSPVLYGLPEFGESGRQTQLLTHAALTILLSKKKAMETTYEWIARELLTQYAQGGFGKLKLHGRDGSNEFFDVELSAKDIEGDWFPEATLLPSLPVDELENMTKAQIAVQNELLSPQTARDRYLNVRDTDLEEDRVLRAKAKRIPSVMIRELARTLAEDGRPDLAAQLIDEFQRLGTEVPPIGKPPKTMTERRGEAVEPEFAQGIPRTMMPSEELGKVQGR